MRQLGFAAVVISLTVGLVLGLSACSNRSLYEGSLMQRLEACESLRPAERDACELRARRPYGEYEQEREAALGHD